jgi:phosphonate transport system permease protein
VAAAAAVALLPGGPLVNARGWTELTRFFHAALQPQLGQGFVPLALEAALVTLTFAVCGTIVALVLGVVGGILASETFWSLLTGEPLGSGRVATRGPWLVVRGLLAIPRGIHEIVWGLIFVNLVGLDPVVGVAAIAIPYGAMTAKVYSETLDETDHGAMRALLAAGAGRAGAFLYGLVPRAARDLASYAFYRFECSIRSAAVLGIVGAGGLGYQIFLSLQSLRYEQMWTFLYALILLAGVTDFWSGLFRSRMGAPDRISLSLGDDGGTSRDASRPAAADPVVKGSLVLFALLAAISFWQLGPDLPRLFGPETAGEVRRLAVEAWPPSLGEQGWGGMFVLAGKTLALSVLAIAVAGVGSLLLAYPAAYNFLLPGGILLGERGGGRVEAALGTVAFALSRLLLLVLRAIPAPITALLLLYVLFPGIVPGALALGLYTLGVLGRLMAETVENLDRRPLAALRAQGASAAQVFLYGVIPATLRRFLSYTLYRWEVAIAGTVMVGLVGAGGLGVLLTEQLSSFAYDAAFVTLAFYVGLLFVGDMVSATVRRQLRS